MSSPAAVRSESIRLRPRDGIVRRPVQKSSIRTASDSAGVRSRRTFVAQSSAASTLGLVRPAQVRCLARSVSCGPRFGSVSNISWSRYTSRRRVRSSRSPARGCSARTRGSSRASRSASASQPDEALVDERLQESGSAPQTPSAASSVQPPRKTESGAKSRCSSASRSSYDHSIVARSVRWRGSASRPPFRRSSRLPSRSSSCSVESSDVRGGRELERERKVVEPRAQLVDVARPARSRLARAPAPRTAPRLAALEHGHRVDVLALHRSRSRLVTSTVRARREQLRHVGRRVDHVLEVVEQEQQPPLADELGRRRPPPPSALRGRRDDVAGSRERRERHPPHAVRVRLRGRASRLEREPRLARAARAR